MMKKMILLSVLILVWTQVNYNGNSGYVMTVFLKKL